MVSLTDLPPKPLTIIILKLEVHDITVLKRVNTFLRDFIKESKIIAYGMNLETSGMLDNAGCPIPIDSKVRYGNMKEDAWNFFKTEISTKITAFDANTSICTTTSTDIFLAKHTSDDEGNEVKTNGIRHITLPSMFNTDDEDGTISWVPMTLNCSVVGFGESLDENDLFALAGYEPDDDDESLYKIVLILLRASTNEIHDEADGGVFSIGRVPKKNGAPRVNIAISGENMAIAVLTSPDKQGGDFLVIMDWKKGEQKGKRFRATDLSLTFVREDLLVNTNSIRGSLDIYQIPSSAEIALNPPEPPQNPDPLQSTPDYLPPVRVRVIHGFSLPNLNPGWAISSIETFSSPPATPGQTLPKSLKITQPYTNHPKHAILVLVINVHQEGNTDNKHVFHMVVHRQALVDLLPKEKLTEYENVVEKLRKRKARAGDISAAMAAVGLKNSEEEDYSTNPYYQFVSWDTWGKVVTRWFDADGLIGNFGALASGQRYVQYEAAKAQAVEENQDTSEAKDSAVKGLIHILDFNPYSVRRAWQGLRSPRLFRGPICTVAIVGIASQEVAQPEPQDDTTWEHAENTCEGHGVFQQPLIGRLPFIRVMGNTEYDYDGVLLNEHSIIGVTLKEGTNHVAVLTSMYVG